MNRELALQLFRYDREGGVLYWQERPAEDFSAPRIAKSWNAKHAGKPAGWLRKDGYLEIKVAGHQYLVHRIIWLIETGDWPSELLDHIDGKRSRNLISNLREATYQTNAWNRTTIAAGSSSRYLGVMLRRDKARWSAQICVHRKLKHLGYFDSEEDAAAAYAKAKSIYHPLEEKRAS